MFCSRDAGDSQCIQSIPTAIIDVDVGSALLPSARGPGPSIQAIIPQYEFNCSGFVTQWRVAVRMAKPRPMSFQIWRPIGGSPVAVYSLVGFYSVTNVGPLAMTRTFSITVPTPSSVLVMAGDVIGYSYGGSIGDWRIQLNTTSSQITVFYVTTAESNDMVSLHTFANATGAPLVSADFLVLPSSQTSPTELTTLSTAPSKAPAIIMTTTQHISTQANVAQVTVTMAAITQDAPTPPTSTVSSVVVIVVTVTTLLTVLLMLVVAIAVILLCIKLQKKQQSGSVKREALNQHYTDIALRKSSLVPLVTKIHTGFQPEMSLSSTIEESHVNSTLEKTHVNSPNYYSLAHNSVDDCPDDVTGQFYTAPKTGVDAMTNKYDTTRFLEDMYWSPALTTSGLYEQLAAHRYEEIPTSQLRILNALGSGQFGQVWRGHWTIAATFCTDVAIKMLKDGASEEDKVKFLQEAAIMGQFSHPNVVKMYGVVTVDNPPMIVLELMARGDLHSFLIMATILQKYDQEQLKKIFLKFSQEIAFGMLYLSRKSFVHRDLAARNVLLTNDLTCKIGDFGMARNLIDEVYYTTKGGAVPVKWTAPEALLYKKYSTASDVYSFGMVMYEMWGLGTKPFHDVRNIDVPHMISLGYCLAPPPGCPRAIYSLMVDCWHPQYDKRPHFKEVADYFKKPEELLLYWSAEDHASAGGGADIGSSLSSTQHLFPDLQNKYKESHEHC
eukprot:Em0020g1033a